ncbi:hypothetical protein D1BOALGB6SA_1279 [Olavius sp. associated proteobacterium Delta 1]|nr:hypothetical protein D1BOALGB6SA_1279 [Olavius sp. associated proteobacterium Delta 1]
MVRLIEFNLLKKFICYFSWIIKWFGRDLNLGYRYLAD